MNGFVPDGRRITPVSDAPSNVKGYVQRTSVSAATGLGTVPADARYAIINVEGASVRWRDDGTDPTTTVGMPQQVGDTIVYDGDLTAIKFIETSASAKLNVSFYS